MIQGKQAGTVRYYGTPAEEGGGGKVFMVREGLLKDVDAVVTLAPGRSEHGQPGQLARHHHRQFQVLRHSVARRRRARPGPLRAGRASRRWTTW